MVWETFCSLVFTPVLTCTLIVLAISLFIWNSSSVYDVWKKKGVPQVKTYPLFGSLLDNVSKKPFQEVEQERYQTLGPIYGFYEGDRPMLSVADPKLLRNILVKNFQFFTNRRTLDTGDEISESMMQLLQDDDWKRVRTIVSPTFTTGKIKRTLDTGDEISESMMQLLQDDDWKRVRTIVSPTFTTGKIKRMMDVFTSCSKALVANFRKYAEKGEPVNVKTVFGPFATDTIASAAFSTKLDAHKVETARSGFFNLNINYRFIFYLLFPRLAKFFKLSIVPPGGVKFYADLTLKIIKERKRTGQKCNDFLQLLLDAADEMNDEEKMVEKSDDILSNYEGETIDQVFKGVPTKKSLSSNELVAQCVIFFMAGAGTSASALSFASYYLALYPDVQDRLREEVDKSILENDGVLNYEAIQSMKYLDNVISEALRITPPATRLERMTSANYTLGDTGIIVPKGTVVTIPVYAIQRDPKFFPDPENFDPDRFLPEERANRNPYTFMPFGSGPRNCVGMRFALVEVKVCLAYVLSYFKIKRCAETKVPLDFSVGHGLLQPKEITLLMEARNDTFLKD